MTVKQETIGDFKFENSWILGAGWEQVLAWFIWKQGHDLVFDPRARVFHISHGQTLSRQHSNKKAMLFQAEQELLFYRLYGKENGLSALHHLISFAYRSALMLKKKKLPQYRGIVAGNLIGVKRLISDKTNSDYSLLKELEKIYQS